MRKDLEIKDERGTINITVQLVTFTHGTDIKGNQYRYDISERTTPKGKRKPILNTNLATPEEIKKAKLMLWESIKPI